MKWNKIKNLFCPNNIHSWMFSHAANPVPFILDEEMEIVRIYFTCRNENNMSHIGYVDIDFKNNYNLINISESPVVTPGDLGMFDDSGAAMGCLIKKDSDYYLFFLGWNLKVTVPWQNSIGLAKSTNSFNEFIKYSKAPILDRSDEDPFSISYPFILFDNGIYRMWYGSNLSWGKDQSEMRHVIKYAESTDLLHWNRTNAIHIPLMHKNEYAISKPWVVKEDGIYRMWYSFRGNGEIDSYRIGYAESTDGFIWQRKDESINIDVSVNGWDSEMLCYPSVLKIKNKTYMLYNGNSYGSTGFGIAELISSP